MVEFGIFLLLVSVVAIPTYLTFRRNKLRRVRWAEAAAVLGFKSADLWISGDIDGVEVSVAIKFHGGTSEKSPWTRWTAQLHGELPAGLDIQPEDVFQGAAKLVGFEDAKVGIKSLDDNLIIRADDEDVLRAWAAREGVADALAELIAFDGRFKLTPKTIWYEYKGQEVDVATLVAKSHSIATLARALTVS